MKKYAAVVEEGPSNYSADMREAIEFHLEGMIEDGDPVPEPSSHAIEVDVEVGVV